MPSRAKSASEEEPTKPVPAVNQPEELRELPLSAIRPNPDQPRKSFPQRQLRVLEDSIRAAGLVQPIVVRPLERGTYEIVAGERRYRAFVRLAKDDDSYRRIPAIVRQMACQDVGVAALVENVVREDLNPVERARALQSLKAQLDTSWSDVAERVGLTVRAVHFLTGTLKLRSEFREAVENGLISAAHSRSLKRLQTRFRDAAYELYEYLLEHPRVTSREADAIAKVLMEQPAFTAEEAHAYLSDDAEKGNLPSLRRGPVNTPFRQVMRGMKTLLGDKGAEALNVAGLTRSERSDLHQQCQRLRRWLDSLDT